MSSSTGPGMAQPAPAKPPQPPAISETALRTLAKVLGAIATAKAQQRSAHAA